MATYATLLAEAKTALETALVRGKASFRAGQDGVEYYTADQLMKVCDNLERLAAQESAESAGATGIGVRAIS